MKKSGFNPLGSRAISVCGFMQICLLDAARLASFGLCLAGGDGWAKLHDGLCLVLEGGVDAFFIYNIHGLTAGPLIVN